MIQEVLEVLGETLPRDGSNAEDPLTPYTEGQIVIREDCFIKELQ